MTYQWWHDSELRRINNEIINLKRHTEFLYTMNMAINSNIDWDCYWSWYTNSDCDSADAIRYSRIEEQKGNKTMLTLDELLEVLLEGNETITIEDYDDFFIIETTFEEE